MWHVPVHFFKSVLVWAALVRQVVRLWAWAQVQVWAQVLELQVLGFDEAQLDI